MFARSTTRVEFSCQTYLDLLSALLVIEISFYALVIYLYGVFEMFRPCGQSQL